MAICTPRRRRSTGRPRCPGIERTRTQQSLFAHQVPTVKGFRSHPNDPARISTGQAIVHRARTNARVSDVAVESHSPRTQRVTSPPGSFLVFLETCFLERSSAARFASG